MLTLADINEMTNSNDGCIYSDLYKDVYGTRPRNATFFNLEDFDADMKYLSEALDRQIAEDNVRQQISIESFETDLKNIMDTVANTTREDALRLLLQAQDFDMKQIEFYGYEVVEHEFNLPYGYIKKSFT